MPSNSPRCSSPLRPDVVLFGELTSGPEIENLQSQLKMGFDLVFSIGTGRVFPYIQSPLPTAKGQEFRRLKSPLRRVM